MPTLAPRWIPSPEGQPPPFEALEADTALDDATSVEALEESALAESSKPPM